MCWSCRFVPCTLSSSRDFDGSMQVLWPVEYRVETYAVSGLNASAMPATMKLPQKTYMGHSQPSGSGFSPGLMPQSQPDGGSNCDSLPWPPPCCRAETEKDRELEVSGRRAHRTARSGATVCRIMAIVQVVSCAWLDETGDLGSLNGCWGREVVVLGFGG